VKVLRSANQGDLGEPEGLFLTIGNFDGVHRGHRAVLREVVSAALSASGRSVAVTFEPHPANVVGDAKIANALTPLNEKSDLLAETGVDTLLVVPFTKDTAASSARAFLSRLGVGGGSHLVLGYDFHMGRGRAADLGRLSLLGREAGFGLDVVPPVMSGGRPISSTRIRAALREGDPRAASLMLGRHYSLEGRVVAGDGIGRSIGVPTANLELPAEKLLPADGVYLTSVVDLEAGSGAAGPGGTGAHRGLLYVGRRPTLGSGSRRAEVHILDVDADLYGTGLRLDVIGFLRHDRSFSSVDDLKEQMSLDIERAGREG